MRGSISLRAVLVLAVFSAVIMAAGVGSAHAVTVIYEPFADSEATLAGNTPGLGLSGTWSGNAVVQAGTLTYGSLPTPTGSQVATKGKNGYVSVGSTLSSAGLLADGESLWFSVLVRAGSDIGTNGDVGFELGTDQLNASNNLPIANSGTALGFTFKNNQLRASYWSGGSGATRSTTNSGNSAPNDTLYLVAGKYTWGASSDMIEIYKVGTNLSLGSPVSWYTTAVDQSLFDTLAFAAKNDGTNEHLVDEIRFGHTYDDVIAFPTAYWDLNGTTPGAGADGEGKAAGTWNGANTLWNAAADGIGTGTTTWAAGSVAAFAAGSDATGTYTVTVSGAQDIGGLDFYKGAVTLAPEDGSAALRMTRDSSVFVATGLTATVATPISQDDPNSRSLTKIGNGTLVLAGANTYTGLTTVSAGTLILSGDNSAATGGTNVAAGTLAISGSGTLGNGNLTLGGGGSLNLGGTSQIVGAVSITAAAASGDTIGGGDLTATSYAASNATGAAVVSANLLGSGVTMTKSGAGVLFLSGSNTYDGMTSINAGALVLGKQAAINGGITSISPTNVTVASGAALGLGVGVSASGYFDSTDIDTVLSQMGASTASAGMKPGAQIGLDTTNAGGTFSRSTAIGNLSGGNSVGLAKLGEGTLILDAANTYSGVTTVYAGTLTAGAGQASAFGSAPSLAFGPGSTGKIQLNGNSFTVSSLTTDATVGTPVVENGAAGDVTLTVSNSAANTYAGKLQDGSGGGALSLVKAGTGTLTLSGANTYSGGTTLSGGTVVISNATSLGAGNVTVSGSSQINATIGITYANDIAVNAGLSLRTSATGTATYSGVLSGSSAITIVSAALSGGNTGTHAFTNTGNNFTGNVILPSATGSSEEFSFASIGDGGNFTFARPSWREAVIYTGAADITFNSRQIALASTIGTAAGTDGNGRPVNQFQNNGAGTVTFMTNMVMPASIATSTYFTFAGSNTGNNTFAGLIANPGGANTLGIAKFDAGKWILSNTNNSYLGNTLIANGTLSVPAIDVKANAQPLGKGSLVQLGQQGNSGTLEFTGSTNSTTDKQVQIGNTTAAQVGAGSILNNGSGSLTFTNATFNPTIAGITATRTLTLGGSYVDGSNEIQGTIQDNATVTTGKVALTKSGAGTWILSGANSYTGNTTISGGKLYVNGTHTTSTTNAYSVTGTLGGNGTITTVNGAVTVNSGGKLAPGTADAPGTLTLNLGSAALNLSADTGYNLGQFTFRLGTASDQIVLGAGTSLNLGTASATNSSLDWTDFTFIPGTGLSNGVYTLIDTSAPVSGGLCTDTGLLTGPVGIGTGTLSISGGQDLILTVTGFVIPGDTNGDNVVDAADYITVKQNFGRTDATLGAEQGDFDKNSNVDWDDLQILMGAMSTRTIGEAPAAPEPATLGLLAIGALAVLRRRRKA